MTDDKVKVQLAITLVVITLLPLLAAFYFLDSTLRTSLDLGFNPQIRRVLEADSENLIKLRDADPEHRSRYREQFEEVENLKRVYAQPELAKAGILASLRVYFGVGFVAALLLALGVAVLLSRRIARSYKVTFDELVAHREKVRYLQEMSSWQELARMLAHEIKNPLTPIEVLVGSLSRAHASKTPEEFRDLLGQVQTMIAEELNHLKRTVSHFSEFAKLPHSKLTEQPLAEVIRQHVAALAPAFERASIHLEFPDYADELHARVDATLLRQVMANILANGVEANPGQFVHFTIRLSSTADTLQVSVSNDGAPVSADLATRMFDPYISGQSGPDNAGLGLAIVKKIVIEHGGEIAYREVGGHPTFAISLTRVR